MGRTDLARFRKNAPSVTPPVAVPHCVAWVFDHVSSHPHREAMHALQAVRDASSQRAQVCALKLLGIHLFQAHDHKSQSLCACRLSSSLPTDDLHLCRIVTPFLFSFLFKCPTATPGLVAAVLHALYQCNDLLDPEVFALPLRTFLDRFDCQFDGDKVSNLTDGMKDGDFSICDPSLHADLAANMNALSAMMAHPLAKLRILKSPPRVVALVSCASYLVETYIFFSDNTGSEIHSSPTNRTHDSNLVESSCDVSVKVLQDISNTLLQNATNRSFAHCAADDALSRSIYHCCERLLQLSSTPRSCSLACAIAFVTTELLRSSDGMREHPLPATLCERVLTRLSGYPPFSQLSLVRAVLDAPVSCDAVSDLLFASSRVPESPTNITSIFDILESLTSQSVDVHFRFLTMETIITCLRRYAPAKLDENYRDRILSLIYQRLEEPFSGIPAQMREAMSALVAVDGGGVEATAFWETLTLSLVTGDWRSKGMYAPLCVLVKRVGALYVLKEQPECQSLPIRAAALDSHLVKAVSDWLVSFWTVLNEECGDDFARFSSITVQPLVDGLLSAEFRQLRERVAENILPVFLKTDNGACVLKRSHALLQCLSKSPRSKAHRVRGTIMILSTARNLGASIDSLSDSHLKEFLASALTSCDEDLRSSAFNLVATTSSPTTPFNDFELELVLSYLPHALTPGSSPAERSRFRHSMRRFAERFAACRYAAVRGSSGWWLRERKRKYGGRRTPEFESVRLAFLKRLDRFEQKCVLLLLSSYYPGSPPSRRTTAAEVLSLILKNTSLHALMKGEGEFRQFHIVSIVAALVAGVVDGWERPRRAAVDLIGSLPSPLAGFAHVDDVLPLHRFAHSLLNSARQSNVDSGACLCRSIFLKFVLGPGFDTSASGVGTSDYTTSSHLLFDASIGNNVSTPLLESGGSSIELLYAQSLLSSIEEMNALARSDFHQACKKGLFNGRFLVMRYIIQDFPWVSYKGGHLAKLLKSFVTRLVNVAINCAHIAVDGVSYRKFNQMGGRKEEQLDYQHNVDVPVDYCHDFEEGDDSLVRDDDSNTDERDSVFLKDGRQVESTSCFQSAKEICVVLGVLCHQATLDEIRDDESICFLDYEQVKHIGELFSYVFTNTRHWGVLDGASEGLQLLCERLLSSASMQMRQLPNEWIASIVDYALAGKLYVLRRSAGIPWLISAVVNAEAAVNRKSHSHESSLLNGIVLTLIQHLKQCSENNSEPTTNHSLGPTESKADESRSHALNLLRILFLNSNVASNILKFFEDSVICCIDAFCSPSWLVRNSAMMLYTALLRRGIGGCRGNTSTDLSSAKVKGGTSATIDGANRVKGIPAFQFFSRYPRLRPFLLMHLERAISAGESNRLSHHTALYPTLYLLSCLSSTSSVEAPSSSTSKMPFWVLVRQCSHWRSEFVRRSAAAACVPLINGCSLVPLIISEIMEGVPCIPSTVSLKWTQEGVVGENCDALKTSTKRLSQNKLHGDLITIEAILRNTIDLMSTEIKQELAQLLSELLPERLWIAVNPQKNECNFTRACMVDVLTLSHRIALDAGRDDVVNLCDNVADQLISQRGSVKTYHVVGAAQLKIKSFELWRETASRRYECGQYNILKNLDFLVKTISECWEKDIFVISAEMCATLIRQSTSRSSMNNRRDKGMEPLLCHLWLVLNEFLGRSMDKEMTLATLHLMNVLLEVCLSDLHYHSSKEFVSRLQEVNPLILHQMEKDSCVEVQEQALVLCGQWVTLNKSEDVIMRKWIEVALRACKSQHPTIRIAAIQAMCNSVFKKELHNSGTKRPLADVWDANTAVQTILALVSLLEDDNSDVCQHALTIACDVLGSLCDGNMPMPQHILPTMMNLYGIAVDKYDDNPQLIYRLKELLTLGGTGRGQEVDDLIDTLAALSNTFESYLPTGSVSPSQTKTMREAQFHNDTKGRRPLFEEESCTEGESILQMQAVTWSIIRQLQLKINVRRERERVGKICRQELERLASELGHQSAQDINPGTLIMSGSWSVYGFRACIRQILRVLLAMECAMMCGLEETVSFVREEVVQIGTLHKGQVHPTVTSALLGLTQSNERSLPHDTFFLLPREDMKRL